MRKAETMQTARADLAAESVERQLTVERYAPAAFDESSAFADFTEAKRLEPRESLEAEPVVELDRVHIGRLVVSSLPEIRSCGVARHPFGLIPTVSLYRAGHGSDT